MTDLLFSPLDTRYSKDLPFSLSEQAVLGTQTEVERVWLETLMSEGICPRVPAKRLSEALEGLGQEEVEKIEERTRHATRALVEAIAARLSAAGLGAQAEWTHVGLTSFDTVDTALRLRMKRFFTEDFYPALDGLKAELRRWAQAHAKTGQVGRTHGQWAVPTLFGLQFAEALDRIAEMEPRLREAVADLRGQSSGAIGGYHASSLLSKKPLELEAKFLGRLGLKPHYGSTQILPPEDLLACASDTAALCSVVAKLATDLRHLARSEIGEIAEGFAPGQVGSSTMPQKRNPWNLEHVCSLWKVLLSRLQLLQLDLVSEHHRDLTNSASGRFHHEVFAVAYLMIKRLTRVLSRMEAVKPRLAQHLEAAGPSVLAEAFYVLGTKHGIKHAHDVVREAARESEATGETLFDVLASQGWLPRGLTQNKLREDVLAGSRQKLDLILKRHPAPKAKKTPKASNKKETRGVRTRRG
jgi:adenylosuccinate lyase